MYAGGVNINPPSRFLADIPKQALDMLTPIEQRTQAAEPQAYKPNANFFRAKAEFTPKAKENPEKFKVGGIVEHSKFGKGKILAIDGLGDQKVARIAFDGGEKKLFLSFAPLSIVKP